MTSLSSLESKVLGLENAVDRIAENFVQANSHSNMLKSKSSKGNQSISSPRHSVYTPRPSVDMNNNRSSLTAKTTRGVLGDASFSRTKSSTSDIHDADMWRDSRLNIIRNPALKGQQQSLGRQTQSMACQTRKLGGLISSMSFNANEKQHGSENINILWKRVKDFLSNGDLDSAFMEALCSGDALLLIELLDRTGPVLERLSHETVGELLSTMAVYFLDQRFLGSIIPWLQQVVDLSSTYGPDFLVLTTKERIEFLSATQEAASMRFSNPADKRSVTQLALKLRQVWGKIC